VKSNTSNNRKRKAQKGFSCFEDLFSFYLPGVIIVFLMFVMCIEICLRWLFRTSLMGVVEIVESAMVVITFASLSGIQRDKGHVRMNLFIDRLSGKRSGTLLEVLSAAFIFIMIALLLYPFTEAVIRFKQANEMTEYMCIPLWLVGLSMPLGLLMLCIRVLGQGVWEGKRLFKVSDDPAA
jgi:TRAP-type C4-dicarboxylate transport system permease small subunit